jgi:site-specific DNA-adenine methylase
VLNRALPEGSVALHSADCVVFLQECPRADFVYFDPPWGGTEYQDHARMALTLSDQPVGTGLQAAGW